jgi:hypothetical protein
MGLKAFLFDEQIIRRGISQKTVTSVTLGNGTLNPDHLNECERDSFEERAAIMQYDGGLSRDEAERAALKLALEKRMN